MRYMPKSKTVKEMSKSVDKLPDSPIKDKIQKDLETKKGVVKK